MSAIARNPMIPVDGIAFDVSVRKKNGDSTPGHVCRAKGQVQIPVGRGGRTETIRYSPGDLLMLDGGKLTVVRGETAAKMPIETPTVAELAIDVRDDLHAVGTSPDLPDLLADLCGRFRRNMMRPEKAASTKIPDMKVQLSATLERRIFEMDRNESRRALERAVIQWNSIASRHNPKWTRSVLREGAVRMAIQNEVARLEDHAKGLRAKAARLQPYTSYRSAALTAARKLLVGRKDSGDIFVSPAEANKQIEKLRRQETAAMTAAERLRVILSQPRIDYKDAAVAAVIERKREAIDAVFRTVPEGFKPNDGRAAMGAAAVIETLTAQVRRLDREMAAARLVADEPTFAPASDAAPSPDKLLSDV